MAGADRRRRRVLHDDPRRRGRQRRDPVDPARPAHRRVDRPVGDHRLRDHVRRLPPARRPDGRPARTAEDLPRRLDALHGRVAGLRPREQRRPPDRLARRTGARRRDHLARRALDRDDDVRGGRGAEQGPRDLGRARWLRRSRRRAARRDPDQVPRLGVDLLRQRPRRRTRVRADAADRAGEPRRPRASPVRRRRRRFGHGRPRAARLRDLEGARRRLGDRPDDRAADRVDP